MRSGINLITISTIIFLQKEFIIVNGFPMLHGTIKRWRGVGHSSNKRFEFRSVSIDDEENSNIIVQNKDDDLTLLSPLSYTENMKQDSSGLVFSSNSIVGWRTVFTTALMITGGTIGASALVLPQFVAKSGMSVSIGLFLGIYILNLLSGLFIAEVAIKQREDDGEDVPSSFKDFAESNLNSSFAAYVISAVSLFSNACVCAFDLATAGEIISKIIGRALPSSTCLIGFASLLVLLRATQSGERISRFSSIAVAVLIASFFCLLLPGLQNVQNPMETFLTPGTSSSLFSGVTEAAPIILTTATYQNVVPSVTKILRYDRKKTAIAISVGSFLPILFFMAWSFACLGGGIDQSVGGDDLLYTIFSMAAVIGSSIGCTLAIAEEMESIADMSGDSPKDMEYTNPLVTVAAVGVPSAGSLMFAGGEDFSIALKLAGEYGSPLLYGALPAVMAWTQRKKIRNLENLVPGGFTSILVLGAFSAVFFFNELATDLSISAQQML